MKTIPAFAAFDRMLKEDHAADEAEKLEWLGIEPELKRTRGRPPGSKNKTVAERRALQERKLEKRASPPSAGVMIPGDLIEQMDAVADALGMTRTPLARILLAAGIEALVREAEANGGRVTFPFCLGVMQGPEGFYYPQVRTLSAADIETYRMPPKGEYSRWHFKNSPAQPE